MKPEDLPEGAKQDKNGVWRNNLGHILPGQVNNPKGRKQSEKAKAFRELAQTMSEECLHELFRIVTSDATKDADKIRAADIIMDRGFGKPMPRKDDDDKPPYVPQPIIINGIEHLMQMDQEITDEGESLMDDDDNEITDENGDPFITS